MKNNIAALFLTLAAVFVACKPSDHQAENNYRVKANSSNRGDVATGYATEITLEFTGFSAKVQQLSFYFSADQVSILVDGTNPAPGQRVPVVLDGTTKAKFKVTGLKAGTHSVTVRAENNGVWSSCVVDLSISDRVYRIQVLEDPAKRLVVGWHEPFRIKITNEQNPNHLFYATPGYKLFVRSLGDAHSIIEFGMTEVWCNVPDSVAIEDNDPIQWANNETIMVYRAFSAGEHQVEFKVQAPDGSFSRTVVTIPVDESQVELTPRQTPKTVLCVTETHEATFDVNYLGHPKNRVALMWEELDSDDPYCVAPDVTIDFVRPAAGEWGPFKNALIVGSTSYPRAPGQFGSKQGFRLHIKDMYGWSQSFEYRFDVVASNYKVSLVESDQPYVQNVLNHINFRIEDYPSNSQFRYKFVRPESTWCSITFLDRDYDVWYDLDLSGQTEPVERSVSMGYGNDVFGSFTLVVEDKYGVQNRVDYQRDFEPNELDLTLSKEYMTTTVGVPVTVVGTLNIPQEDQHSYKDVIWKAPRHDPQSGLLKVEGQELKMAASGPYQEVMPQTVVSGERVAISYTPSTPGLHEIRLTPVSWYGDGHTRGQVRKTLRVYASSNHGSFVATPDQRNYEIPYVEERVHQDVYVALASENESEGLYDWDATYHIGTSVYYSSTGSMGQLFAVDGSGKEIAIAPKSTLPLQYAVGKTLHLRHYPAKVNDGSLERIALTVTRRDGVSTSATFTIDAEDKGFELVEDQADWHRNYPKVGRLYTIPVKVVNRSKYYRGSYTLKSYVLTKEDHPTTSELRQSLTQGPCTNLPLNGSMWAFVQLYATEYGSGFSIDELVIQDEFGRGVTHQHGGFSFSVLKQ